MKNVTLLVDGADDAIIGYINRCGQPMVVIYDYQRLVEHFVSEGMSEDEATEWIEFNIIGAWIGEGTPGVLMRATNEDILELIDEAALAAKETP
jgi:hypothetical protein